MPPDRNILIVLTSGYRTDAVGLNKVWPIDTPNLDEMASNGLQLNAVTSSPGQIPSLVSFYTGVQPRQHGILTDAYPVPQIDGWMNQFREAGYHTAGVGRIGPIADQLHDSVAVSELTYLNDAYCSYTLHAAKKQILKSDTQRRRHRQLTGPYALDEVPAPSTLTDVDAYIAHQSCEMINRLPSDKPWVMVVAFTGPGNDLPCPKAYRDLLPREGLDRGFVVPDLSTIDDYAVVRHPRTLLQRMTPSRLHSIRRHYFGRVLMLDHHVNLIRESVDRYGHASKTWMMLNSDHGKVLGEYGYVGHESFLSSASYVPFWILPPGGMKSFVETQKQPDDEQRKGYVQLLFSMPDIVQTICAIGCVDTPRECQGISALQLIRNQIVGHEAVISEYGQRMLLETLNYKVVYDLQDRRIVTLFDIAVDPREKHNLAGTHHEANVADQLRFELADVLMGMRPTIRPTRVSS